MIILLLGLGMLFGGIAAGVTLFSGGSLLLAALSYSLIGTIGVVLCVAAFAMRSESSIAHSDERGQARACS
jgi:hypothetical protein